MDYVKLATIHVKNVFLDLCLTNVPLAIQQVTEWQFKMESANVCRAFMMTDKDKCV